MNRHLREAAMTLAGDCPEPSLPLWRRFYYLDWCYEFDRVKERGLINLAWLMPRKLAYWCAMRVFAECITGTYSHRIVGTVTIIEALNDWTTGKSKK